MEGDNKRLYHLFREAGMDEDWAYTAIQEVHYLVGHNIIARVDAPAAAHTEQLRELQAGVRGLYRIIGGPLLARAGGQRGVRVGGSPTYTPSGYYGFGRSTGHTKCGRRVPRGSRRWAAPCRTVRRIPKSEVTAQVPFSACT